MAWATSSLPPFCKIHGDAGGPLFMVLVRVFRRFAVKKLGAIEGDCCILVGARSPKWKFWFIQVSLNSSQAASHAMNIRAIFTHPPREGGSTFRYGFLVVCLLLLAFHIQWRLTLSPDYRGDRNVGGVVALMLLFNHLAFYFRWPTSVTVALRLLAWVWLAFGCFYIFYWSHILYP